MLPSRFYCTSKVEPAASLKINDIVETTAKEVYSPLVKEFDVQKCPNIDSNERETSNAFDE